MWGLTYKISTCTIFALAGSLNYACTMFIWTATWKKTTNDMCTQRRLSSAWASLGSWTTYWVHNEDSDQTAGQMPLAGCTGDFVGFAVGGSCIFIQLFHESIFFLRFLWHLLLTRVSSYTASKNIKINFYNFYNWAGPWENVSYVICKQQRPRSACASAQSDQRLCCLLLR